MQVNMQEAKSQLSRLGKAAWAGEDVVIAKAGEPYLRLVPYRKPLEKRKLGGLEGQIWMSPDFDEPDEELMDLIENSKIVPDRESAGRLANLGGSEPQLESIPRRRPESP